LRASANLFAVDGQRHCPDVNQSVYRSTDSNVAMAFIHYRTGLLNNLLIFFAQ